MANLARMKKKAAKRLQSGETKTFDKEARKQTRGEAFDPTEHQGVFYPPLPWTRSGKINYFKIGYFEHADGRMTYVIKYNSSNGPKYYVVPEDLLYDAMEKCDERKVAWDAVKAANNQTPIKFEWKKKSGFLAPVPAEIYARKIGATPSRSSEPRQSIRTPPKPNNDSAIAKAAQASAKARAKKKRKSRSKSSRSLGYVAAKKNVSFEEPESDSNVSVGLSLSESDSSSSCESDDEDGELSDLSSEWFDNATNMVRHCKIAKLIKYIGPANGDRLLRSYQSSGVSPEEVLGTENLIHIAEVAKSNSLAGKTPGMVKELVRITEVSRAPKRVVLFARKLFVQATEDIVSLFMRKLDGAAIIAVENMDERAKLLHTRIMYNMPENTPYSDAVLASDKPISFAKIMQTIKTHIENTMPVQLEAYKYLFMLVYVYGLTFGFVLVPARGIEHAITRQSSKF
jgi:hypothetical protein